tara:strand:- start:52 stop:555 length:504 start_codon:yes stop_codon:yes gene_type:complete
MFKLFYISTYFFFLITVNSYSVEKIVYLDLDFLLANSNKGKEIIINLEKINKENIKILKEKKNLLNNEEKKLLQQKNILTSEIYSEKRKSLKNQIKNFNEEKNTIALKFKKQREEKINNFLKIVDKILAEYVKKNSIDIVLNKKDILMGKNNYNITNDIMQIINNEN